MIYVKATSLQQYASELYAIMYHDAKLSKLHLDEHDKIGYTYKTLGAAFWAFRQDDFRKALTAIVMEVIIQLCD